MDDLQQIGVYKIYFKERPERVYIGSTAFRRKNSIKTGFRQRKYNHTNTLVQGTHCNRYLQRAFNKYGLDNLVFEIIEVCENVVEREQHWIDHFECYKRDKGYNLVREAFSMKGYKKTKEQIDKHRESLKNYYKTNTIHNKIITEDLIEKVRPFVKAGAYYKDACKELGIKKSTYYNIKLLL